MKLVSAFCLIFFSCFAAIKCKGQTSLMQDSVKEFKHAIGAGAGFTTGYGLSYRFIPKRFGMQVNFAPYHTSETDRYSVGLTFLCRLIQSRNSNLFLYQGNHYFYNSETISYVERPHPGQTTEPPIVTTKNIERYVNNGLGIGIEFIIAKRIAFDLMAGYAAYDNFNKVNFTGETGLYFKF
ncbi:MAG TPA: hypothetical protein VGC65_11030 [Bacteroidia bacterium]|jgi:hypothetical protein